jgi:hypothetical protein
MSQNVMTPLLSDSRLILPDLKSSKIAAPTVATAPLRYSARQATPLARATAVQKLRASPASAGTADPRAALPPAGTPLTPDVAQKIAPPPKYTAPVQPTPAAAVKKVAPGVELPPPPTADLMPPAAAAGGKEAPPAANAGTAAPKPIDTSALARGAAGLGTLRGMGAGALLGGLKGVLDPGMTTDENGNPVQKSRIGATLGGLATGAAAGGLAAPLIRAGGRTAMNALPAPKVAKVILALPTFPFTKHADRIITHPGHPGPTRTESSDPTVNRATGGPACTNTDAVTSTSKMAEEGPGYPKGMAKGPDGAKAETEDHKNREAIAKQEVGSDLSKGTIPTHGIEASAVDRNKAVAAFPVLNNKK